MCTCVSTSKAIKNWMIQSCRPQSPEWWDHIHILSFVHKKGCQVFLGVLLHYSSPVNPSKTTKQPPTLSTQIKSHYFVETTNVSRQRCNSRRWIVQENPHWPIQLLHKCSMSVVYHLAKFCVGRMDGSDGWMM